MRTTLRTTTTSTTTAPSTAMAGTTGDPDMALIGELLEEITRHPPAIDARKLLVEHYMSVGWLEAALDNAKDLHNLNPGDTDVAHFLSVLQKKSEPPAPEEKKKKIKTPSILSTPSVASSKKTTKRVWDVKTARYITVQEVPQPQAVKIEAPAPNPISDFETEKQEFTQGYEALRTKAKYVISNLLQLQSLQRQVGLPPSKHTSKIQAIAEGQRQTATDSIGQPASARSVARTIRDRPEDGTALALADFEDTMNWIRQSSNGSTKIDVDQLRDGLIKRKHAVESALPDGLKLHCEIAFMHVEHENLSRNYANTETMLGDEVKDIARENFYVTEDNYAWDMEELVQAITVGKGIMRNPLSKEMFTPSDVKGILLHPLGKPLGALAVEQHEMSKGVRTRTIEEMEKLAKILLEDQSADTLPSRKAVDEFLAYIATLPEMEQKAIEHLKCPAKDSHTGRAYDFSIGEAVRDAKGNRVCFHKTGDFISQAAIHLRQNRGVAPDPRNCSTM